MLEISLIGNKFHSATNKFCNTHNMGKLFLMCNLVIFYYNGNDYNEITDFAGPTSYYYYFNRVYFRKVTCFSSLGTV